MSKSLLSQLIESTPFHNNVASLLGELLIGRECTGYPGGAATPGVVVDFELTAPLAFGPPEGDGLRYQIPLEGRGVASGLCKTSESEDYTYARDSIILGTVEVELGPDALVTHGTAELMEGTVIRVTMSQWEANDRTSTDGPPEKIAGEA